MRDKISQRFNEACITHLPVRFHKLETETQYGGNGLHIREFGIMARFDVSHRIGVWNASAFGQGIPG
jgi:hypothetical protein